MKWFIFLVFLLAITARPAMADETFLCTFGQKERVISLIYTNPEKTLPCDIRYKKDGNTKVLWHSNNTEGYCETKFKDFVKKQVGLGWRCNNMSSRSSIVGSYSKPDTDTSSFKQAMGAIGSYLTPNIEEYLVGRYFTQAMNSVNFFKMDILYYYWDTGTFPDSIQAMGIEPTDLKTSSYFSDIALGKDGVFYIKGNENMGTGSIIKQTPKSTLGGRSMEWGCVTNMKISSMIKYCVYDENLKIE